MSVETPVSANTTGHEHSIFRGEPMNTIMLGISDIEVSKLCLGAMYFGSKTKKKMSYELLDQYVEAGGNFIDTANIYARWVSGCVGGESELLLGEWMRERGNRDQLIIATKVGFEYPGVERGLQAWRIEQECEKSLKRLGIETIDLYYAHVDDRNTPQEETLEAFDNLVRAGKVRVIGASNFLAWRLEEAMWISQQQGWTEYCCVQQRYTYLRPRAGTTFDPQISANDDLLDYCKARGLTMLAYSPLLNGAYSRADRQFPPQYVSADSDKRLNVLREIANETGATVNQVIFAWMLHSEPAVIPLIAASTKEQMQENLDAANVRLTPEQMARLNQA
ncbi:aldo/keto reductase [Candidatus Moduliflexus flocculans]|uniref:Aldo/keto reductase n=1 Tax=Candidatus Moduliflexus flocculans TaxID=1499966 RepID=A0A081BQC4_9BACT|nr:aldo/keto reductase [Candidatus Moduliflexus flocculans]